MSDQARAVALGAALVLAVGVPVGLVGALALDDDSNLVFPLAAVVLAAFVAGGWLASRERRAPGWPGAAVGALAAVIGFAVAQVVSVAVRLAQDDEVRPAIVVVNAALAAACGLLGGALAERARR